MLSRSHDIGSGDAPDASSSEHSTAESFGRNNAVGASVGLEALPSPDTKRWVMRRKAEVVAAVRGGVISLEEACRRYSLSEEEFRSWATLIDKHGVRGLRATRLQEYRPTLTGDK